MVFDNIEATFEFDPCYVVALNLVTFYFISAFGTDQLIGNNNNFLILSSDLHEASWYLWLILNCSEI